MVVDAHSVAYSMAALLHGFIHFRNDIQVAGVIFNKVGSLRHANMLRQVTDDLGITCYGCLPKNDLLETGTRYLGLDFSERSENQGLVQMISEHVDWKALLCLRGNPWQEILSDPMPRSGLRVVVACNKEAFSFYYQETLDGCQNVLFFNPETETPPLEYADMLYLPGGYPEKHLKELASNEVARMAIRDYAERGGHIIAECGGMMYLCQAVVTDDGEYSMCGVLPYTISARKCDRKLSLGYRRFVIDGHEYRGHEFHYTQFLGNVPDSAVQVYDAKGESVPTPVFRYKNVLASYTHFYKPFDK